MNPQTAAPGEAIVNGQEFGRLSNRMAPVSQGRLWAGRIITGLTLAFLVFDIAVKLMRLPVALEATSRLGFSTEIVFTLGIVQLACTLLYVFPRTSILGAMLLTGYLGGATASHVRIGDPFWFPILFGVLVWAGVLLRAPRPLSLLFSGKMV